MYHAHIVYRTPLTRMREMRTIEQALRDSLRYYFDISNLPLAPSITFEKQALAIERTREVEVSLTSDDVFDPIVSGLTIRATGKALKDNVSLATALHFKFSLKVYRLVAEYSHLPVTDTPAEN